MEEGEGAKFGERLEGKGKRGEGRRAKGLDAGSLEVLGNQERARKRARKRTRLNTVSTVAVDSGQGRWG